MTPPSLLPVLRTAVATLLLWALIGCAPPTYYATLEVGEGDAVAGEPQGYVYQIVDDKGVNRTSEATLTGIEVSPAEGVSEGAHVLTFTVAGMHEVKATFEIDGQTLSTSAYVNVLAGPPGAVRLDLDVLEARAGEPVRVDPVLTDTYGNVVSPPGSFELSTSPEDGVSISVSGGTITFSKVADYVITAREIKLGLEASADISIIPGEARAARLELSANRIGPGQSIDAVMIGIDEFGNEAQLSATFSTTPTDGVQVSGDTLEFNEEGTFTVRGDGSGLSAQGGVTVDGTPPQLTVASPERATFQTVSPLMVTGTILDNVAGLDRLRINEVDATISGDQFSLELTPKPGTNVLSFEGKDLNGNVVTWVQSFVYAPAWTALDMPLPGGLYGRLNQNSLDLVADLLVDELDPEELEEDLMAENPIYTYDDGDLTAIVNVTSFGFDVPVWGLLTPHKDSASGYLGIEAIFSHLYASLEAHGVAYGKAYEMTGTLSASEGIATGNAYATITDGQSTVTLKNVIVSLNGFNVSFSGAALNAIAAVMKNAIQAEIEQALTDLILDEVPPLLEDTLEELNYVTDLEIEVGDTTAVMTIQTVLESIRFDDSGCTIGETTTVGSRTVDPTIPENPGAPRVGASGLSYGATPGYLVSASNDALNSLLYALWMSGVLSYQYTVEIEGGQSLTAAISLPLPPIVKPSDSPGYVLDASAGDIILDLYTDPTSSEPAYRLAVTLVVPATVVSGEGGVTVSVIFDEPQIWYEVLEAPSRGLDAAALGAVVTELADQLLAEAEAEATDVVLPEFEGYQLTITEVGIRGSEWGYLTVGGNLE